MVKSHYSPTVFISYAHSDEHRMTWVSALTKMIEGHCQQELPSIKVVVDQDDGALGGNLYSWMQSAIAMADVVLLILTPDYKEKADRNIAAVGYEYNLIRSELFKKEGRRKKCIPILKQGSLKESMPNDLFHLIGIDMSSAEKLEGGLVSLLRSIANRELINNPEKLALPDPKIAKGQGDIKEHWQLVGKTMLVSMIVGTALVAAIRSLEDYQKHAQSHHHNQSHHDLHSHLPDTHAPDLINGNDLATHHLHDSFFHHDHPAHHNEHHHDHHSRDHAAGEHS